MTASLYTPELSLYLDSLVPPRPEEMQKMEAYAREHQFPIIGPASGYLCYQIARMINAKKIFELGSGYGYSTAWFAKAVEENGGGEVNIFDAIIMLRVIVGLDDATPVQAFLADLNGDGLINIFDAIKLLRHIVGLEDIVACGPGPVV